MKVYGIEILPEWIAAANNVMSRPTFLMSHIEKAITEAGCPIHFGSKMDVANRAVDRLLQQRRKKGEIAFVNGVWINREPKP